MAVAAVVAHHPRMLAQRDALARSADRDAVGQVRAVGRPADQPAAGHRLERGGLSVGGRHPQVHRAVGRIERLVREVSAVGRPQVQEAPLDAVDEAQVAGVAAVEAGDPQVLALVAAIAVAVARRGVGDVAAVGRPTQERDVFAERDRRGAPVDGFDAGVQRRGARGDIERLGDIREALAVGRPARERQIREQEGAVVDKAQLLRQAAIGAAEVGFDAVAPTLRGEPSEPQGDDVAAVGRPRRIPAGFEEDLLVAARCGNPQAPVEVGPAQLAVAGVPRPASVLLGSQLASRSVGAHGPEPRAHASAERPPRRARCEHGKRPRFGEAALVRAVDDGREDLACRLIGRRRLGDREDWLAGFGDSLDLDGQSRCTERCRDRRFGGPRRSVGQAHDHDARRPVLGDQRSGRGRHPVGDRPRRDIGESGIRGLRGHVGRCADVGAVPSVGHDERGSVRSDDVRVFECHTCCGRRSLDPGGTADPLHHRPAVRRPCNLGQLVHHRRRHGNLAAYHQHPVRREVGDDRSSLRRQSAGIDAHLRGVAGVGRQRLGDCVVGRAGATRNDQRQVRPAAHQIRCLLCRCGHCGRSDHQRRNQRHCRLGCSRARRRSTPLYRSRRCNTAKSLHERGTLLTLAPYA